MISRTAKIILPLLLALLLGIAPSVLGSSGTTDGHAAEASPQAVEAPAAHGEATLAAHGEVAADAHGEVVAAHDAAGAAHGDAHASNSLAPAKLKDLFWRTVNFLALLFLLVKFLAKPIGSGLTGRQKQIREEMEALQAKRDMAEQEYKAFETRLAGMEKEMDKVVEKAIAQAHNEKERILADAERAAEDIKRQAEAAVQAEIVDAKRILRDEVAEQAAVMAEELIVKNLTAADQATITEQYLDRLGAVQ